MPPFIQTAHMSLILPRWGLILPKIPHPTLNQPSHTRIWNMYIHKTPQSLPQNTPFPVLNLKVGKMKNSLGDSDPKEAKCLKNGQTFSRGGQFLLLFSLCVCTRLQVTGLRQERSQNNSMITTFFSLQNVFKT